MARAQPEPRHKHATPYENHSNSRPTRNEGRRESAFHSLSRRISQVFNKAVGRESNAADDSEERSPSPETSSVIVEDVREPSQSAIVPSVRERNISVVRKPSLDFSLLKKQADLRVPAHVIIEAYKEALLARSQQQLEQQVRGDLAAEIESPISRYAPPIDVPTLKPLDSAALAHTHAAHSLSSKRKPITSNKRSAAGVTKNRPKPLKHRIQLITKPLVDISQISEDRKHRPGFISANFDVSDDEEEDASDANSKPADESKPLAKEATTQGSLLRRPQVESSKLKQFSERADNNIPDEKAANASAASAPAFSLLGNKPSTSETASEKPPKFSFTGSLSAANTAAPPVSKESGDVNKLPALGPAAKDAGKPLFSFGSAPEAKPAAQSKPLADNAVSGGKPQFSFGGGTKKRDHDESSDSAQPKPAAGFSFNLSQEKKPSFSFSQPAKSNSDNSSDAAKPSSLNTAEQPSEPKKPAFSFNMPAQNQSQNGNAGGSFDFSAASKQQSTQDQAATGQAKSSIPFTFGKQASTPAADGEKPTKPVAFNFGNPAPESSKPAFSFGGAAAQDVNKPSNGSANTASDSSAKPAFSFGASTPSTGATEKPAFSFGTSATKPNDVPKADAPKADTPGFSFGANSSSTTPTVQFNFGSAANPAKESLGNAAAAPAPAFNFGATAGSAEKPAAPSTFTFGKSASQPPPPATSAPQAGFVFGDAAKSSSAQPFTFGQAAGAAKPTGAGGSSNSAGFPASQPFAVNPPQVSNGQPFGGFGMGMANPSDPAGGNSVRNTPTPGQGFTFGAPGAVAGAPQFGFGQSQASSRESTPGTGAPIPGRKIAQVKKRLAKR